MSQLETGQFGRVRELYHFMRGTNDWYYTSDSQDIVAGFITYASANIRRSSIEFTKEIARTGLEITIDGDNPVANIFKDFSPGDVVAVICLRVTEQWDETTNQVTGFGTPVPFWSGRVLGSKWNDSSAKLSCESGAASLRTMGLRRLYQWQCPHVLYGAQCRALRATYEITTQMSAMVGNVVTVNTVGGNPDHTYDGGYLEWSNPDGYTEIRMIKEQVGLDLTISFPMPDTAVGRGVTFYAGCDHTMDDCVDKHSNEENYGGQPYIPVDSNPFGSDPVF